MEHIKLYTWQFKSYLTSEFNRKFCRVIDVGSSGSKVAMNGGHLGRCYNDDFDKNDESRPRLNTKGQILSGFQKNFQGVNIPAVIVVSCRVSFLMELELKFFFGTQGKRRIV